MFANDWGTHDPRWAGIASDRVTIDGTDVHLLRAEPADAARRTDGTAEPLPILLVHGLAGAATNWLDVIGPLAAHAPVVAVDLPGFSHTRPPTPHAARVVPQVRFLARLLDELGWRRVELHGNSMGGLLTLLLAGLHPDRVARLVLTSPAYPAAVGEVVAHWDTELATTFIPFLLSRRVGLAGMRAMYRKTSLDQMVDVTEGLVLPDGVHLRPAMRELAVDQARDALRLPWRGESLAHATADLLDVLTVRRGWVQQATDAVTADILLLWGDHDRLVSRPMVDALTARRGDLTRVDMAGIGHVSMVEVPDRWLQAVRTWRSDLAAGPDVVGAVA